MEEKATTRWTEKNKPLDRYSSRSQRHVASLLSSASFGWRPAGKSPVSDHRPAITAVKKRRPSHFLVPFVRQWRRRPLRLLLLLAAAAVAASAAVDIGTNHFGLGSAPTKTTVTAITSISSWTWTTMIPCRLTTANCWILARRRIRIGWP